jgi:hypothetical protein
MRHSPRVQEGRAEQAALVVDVEGPSRDAETASRRSVVWAVLQDTVDQMEKEALERWREHRAACLAPIEIHKAKLETGLAKSDRPFGPS